MSGHTWSTEGPTCYMRDDKKFSITVDPQPGYGKPGQRVNYMLWECASGNRPATIIASRNAPPDDKEKQRDAWRLLMGIVNARDSLAASGATQVRNGRDPAVPS